MSYNEQIQVGNLYEIRKLGWFPGQINMVAKEFSW